MTIGVAGAGAFGTALAIALGRSGRQTLLWGRNPDSVRDMQASGNNARYLPDASFPDQLQVTGSLQDLQTCDVILVSVPMQSLTAFLTTADLPPSVPLVACCKGIELDTGRTAPEILGEMRPNTPNALLTGPSFAKDIARGLPTALTLACADDEMCRALQKELSTHPLRLYRTDDVTGAALGGALKNVIAIACGAVMGASLGLSARAAILTRGYAEMVRIAQARGGRAETLSGLSGMGDMALTCTSDASRNYRRGLALGQNAPFDPTVTVEGDATARAALQWATKAGIDMPITAVTVQLLTGALTIEQAAEHLLTRPLRAE